jgi:NAD(P)-dependent dehydrogenase (short-subunit alcohol dehydrogenase family)
MTPAQGARHHPGRFFQAGRSPRAHLVWHGDRAQERPRPRDIVTISTGLAVDGLPGSSAYTAGKAALHGLNRTLAKELGPAGILTNILMSGAVDTRPRPPALIEQMKQSAVTGRLTDADEVARTAVFLGSRANGHITGEALRCDGFFVSAVRRARV